MFKNVANQKLIVFAFDATTNLPKTGDAANITAYVSKDYGAATVLADTTATELDATNAKGYYLFDLTQAETNADTLLFTAKSATANIVVVGVPATVYTYPANFTATSIDASGILKSNLVQIDAAATTGNNAILNLKSLNINASGSANNGLAITGGTNVAAISIGGSGTGAGINLQPGATGDGVVFNGGATSGVSLKLATFAGD